MDYYKQKKGLLDSILENTQAQTKLVKEDNAHALEVLIGQRASMMAQVDSLDKQASAISLALSPDQTQALKALLSQVMTLDQVNQSLMQKELAKVQGELRKIRMGRQQSEHYGAEYGIYKEEGIFFDTKE